MSESPSTIALPAGEKTSRRMSYGYVMLPISAAALMVTAPGQTYGVSTFNEPLRSTLGLSHSELSTAYMFGTLLAAVPLTWIGGIIDRRGVRQTTILFALAFGTACCLTAAANNWFSLFVGFLLLRMLGPGAMASVSGNILPHWFHRRLGTAEGLRWTGGALAMALFPTVSVSLIDAVGWRMAYIAFGLCVWTLMIPLGLISRDRPVDGSQSIDGIDDRDQPRPPRDFGQSLTLRQTMRTRSFWIVTGGTSLFAVTYTALFFHSVPLLSDRGLTASDAASLIAVCAASLAATHLLAGMLADRLAAPWLLAAALGAMTAGTGMLSVADTRWEVYAAGMLLGTAQGVYLGASQPLWARYFGVIHIGRIRGLVSTVNVAASSVGPVLFGVCRDTFGSFDAAMTAAVLAPLPLLLLTPLATPPRSSNTPSNGPPTEQNPA